jgi:hypothetical protein
MIKQRFIIQTDHMDSKTASAAVAIAEREHYPGVVSAHCCSSPQLFARIYRLGGFVNPPVQPARSFIARWRLDRTVMSPGYTFGFGWGSDENGLGDQPGPTNATPIRYPFKSFDGGVTFTREQWGQRKFDLNTDGLANYGMYADWLDELQSLGGSAILSDMFRGAEAYLEMWERADGVRAAHCLTAGAARTIKRGASFESVLYRAGQPAARSGNSYTYCVGGRRAVSVAFDRRGRVARVTGNR